MKYFIKLLENLRYNAFWFFDFLKGQPIRKNYNDIKNLIESFNTDESTKRRNNYLKELLLYAVKNTDFYKDYSGFDDISCFPVIDKNIIRNSYSKFVSKEFSNKPLKKVTTSGSTGTPFTIIQDKKKVNRHIADNIYFNECANFRIGTRLYYFRIWNKLNREGYLTRRMKNIVTVDAKSPNNEYIQRVLLKLKYDRSTKSILAYASTYEPFAQFISSSDNSRIKIDIESIISMSEALPETTKHQLKEIFNCPVISRYSNMENGFIAQQCIEENNEYHINSASFFVEILNMGKDEPIKKGELGRIVVTDLFNYAMPLIRYDTGDIGALLENSRCSLKTPVLSKVEGRRTDLIYDTSENIVSPHIVTNTMWLYPHIRQFQFIQESKNKYRLVLNCSENSIDEESSLITEFKYYLGNDAEIGIQYVNEIPQLASGKRKKIINQMNSN